MISVFTLTVKIQLGINRLPYSRLSPSQTCKKPIKMVKQRHFWDNSLLNANSHSQYPKSKVRKLFCRDKCYVIVRVVNVWIVLRLGYCYDVSIVDYQACLE